MLGEMAECEGSSRDQINTAQTTTSTSSTPSSSGSSLSDSDSDALMVSQELRPGFSADSNVVSTVNHGVEGVADDTRSAVDPRLDSAVDVTTR